MYSIIMYAFWLLDCLPPFNVQIYTEATAGIATQAQRGVCLEYKQVPCSAVP